MRILIVILLTCSLNFLLFSQQIESVNIETIDLNKDAFYFPKFSPSGEILLLTSANQQGIWTYNLENSKLNQINDYFGAGMYSEFSANGSNLIFRKEVYKNRRKYSSIIAYDFNTKSEKILESENRYLTNPLKTSTGQIVFKKKNKFVCYDNALSQESDQFTGKLIDNGNSTLILYEDGVPVTLNFSSDNKYLWASISPDESKILYTIAATGTFISDLQGNVLVELGYANAPVWSPDGKWIAYMKDKDNGYYFTESDIFVTSSEGTNMFKVTDTKHEIEMYPQWAPDSQKLVFHTITGMIKIAHLETE